MAYEPHTLVTFGGTLQEVNGADEIWQCGVRGFGPNKEPLLDANLETMADNVWNGNGGSGGGLSATFAAANSKIPNLVALKWVKVANIAPDGSYASEPAIHQGNVLGGGGVQNIPSFCSLAISWGTGKTLGKAIRGRIYPPNYAVGIGGGAKAPTGDISAVLQWGKDLHTTLINALSTQPFSPYVVSKSGESNLITTIRVGNLIDVQRRRKNAVPETYVSSSLF